MKRLTAFPLTALSLAFCASAQDIPTSPPSGMDPLAALFVEACAIYSLGTHEEAEFLTEQGFLYSGPVRLREDPRPRDHSAVYRSTWEPASAELEDAQIHFESDFEDPNEQAAPIAYACRLIVHESVEVEDRFKPESFFQLEDFEDYIPPTEDQAIGITDAWELHRNDRYTGIQSGSPEPGLWVTLIYSYPLTRITQTFE
ncbi:hypothetical protein [Ponticaulis sp.]|uniref:hypothetical protein n=1 Tax=Ponticaulis sp. TaxID=2020902 RepID=UPI00260CE3BE|nr:hypothetical protein [Ponticaulis sp.]MDF1679592.1 hypothetical protein [Ponticaulis sp.]